MTDGRQRGDDRRGAGDGERTGRPVEVAKAIGNFVVGRYLVFTSLLPLLFGSALLQSAWTLGQKQLDQRADRALFTGRAPGIMEDAGWRLDIDPSADPTSRWFETSATARLCARVRFTPTGGEETASWICRNHDGLGLAAQRLTWDEALARGVPVSWLDAERRPEMRLSLSARTAEWVRSVGPENPDWFSARQPHASEPPIVSAALYDLWDDVDDPFLLMLEEWSRPAPAVEVAYREDDPSQALPAVLLDEQGLGGDEGPDVVFVVVFGLIGAIAWGMGWRVATMGASRWIFLGLFVGTLALLPLWSRFLAPAMGWVWGPAEELAEILPSELTGVGEFAEIVPVAEVEDAGDVDVSWTLARSYYAPVLELVPLHAPERPMGSDEVLADLSRQVTERLAAMDDEEVREALGRARSIQEDRGDGEEVGLLFVEAAVGMCGEEGGEGGGVGARGEEVRAAACGLLRVLRYATPSDNPYRLAVEERKRLMSLAGVSPQG